MATHLDGHVGAVRAASAPLALVVVTVMIGVFLGGLDMAIVNVALPTISGNLGASTDEAAWVATGYTLGMMLVMPLNGWLTARFGRKHYYLAAFGLFTVASLLCGTATSVYTLILWRVIQGLGGGALQPIAQAILFESAPAEKRGEMMAIFGLGAVVGPTIGPVLGGWIIENSNWQMLFYFKVPLCILGMILAWFVLGATPKQERSAHDIDWLSFGAMAIGLASLQYVLSRGQREDWFDSSTIVTLSIVTVVALAYFIRQQWRAAHPFVNLRVFRSVSFATGSVVTVVSGFGMYGVNLVTPLFFQGPLGLSAYNAGLYLVQGAVATAISMILVGELTKRFDARAVIALGLVLFIIGAWMMGDLTAGAGYWDLWWPRILQGVGLGFLFVPLTVATLAGVPRENMSDATGIATLVRYLGGNIGIALLQVLQVTRAAQAQDAMSASAVMSNVSVSNLVHGGGLHAAAMQLAGMIASNASLISYLYLFRVSAIIFAICLPLLLLLPRRSRT
jgi:DHA2 family multidrug resistance protein